MTDPDPNAPSSSGFMAWLKGLPLWLKIAAPVVAVIVVVALAASGGGGGDTKVSSATKNQDTVVTTTARTTTLPPTTTTPPTTTAPPTTAPAATTQPATQPPATEPPQTAAPETQPPATEAPATEPPATQPARIADRCASGRVLFACGSDRYDGRWNADDLCDDVSRWRSLHPTALACRVASRLRLMTTAARSAHPNSSWHSPLILERMFDWLID